MLNKRRRKIRCWLILPALIAGILIGIASHYCEELQYQQEIPNVGVRFGDVIIDEATGEIRFPAEIRQNEGWVRFLVYLFSYRWLEEEAAIISPANLTDLQKAFALLDWQLWDELWFREITGQEIEVFVKWPGGDKAEGNELIELPYHLGVGDLVFLGSPLFDPLFLARCARTLICLALKHGHLCPLFFLQESVEEKFTRADGAAGYYLNPEQLPPPGTRVTIIIRVAELVGGE